MSTITLRLVKGAPLTNQEVDDNFANLNNDKYEAGDSASLQDLTLTGMSGPIAWNVDDGALDIPLNADVTLQTGQEFVFYAKATEAISNGDVVMFAGAQGGHLLIAKADMSAVGFDPTWIVGVATQDFAINEFGYTTALGKVRGLDTSALSEGDILYVDPTTAGAYTTTKPSSPNHIIQMAAVVRSHGTQGAIQVRVTHIADTDEVPEGATNLYFTDARAVAAIKADAGWNATNWDTAYGWGNHADAGYLTSHQDISGKADLSGDTFTGPVSFTESGSTFRIDPHGAGVDLHSTGNIAPHYQTNFTLYTGNIGSGTQRLSLDSSGNLSVTGTISATGYNKSNWDTAYGWGDHASAGYLTSFTETDPTVPSHVKSITTTDISQWDTAYGWGNHASAGYLTSIPSPSNGNWWNNGFVKVGSDGVMEMGKYMDFHTSNSGGSADYDLRVTVAPGVFTVGGQVNATGGNSGQWNIAYGWGNHASQGYATQTYVNNAVSNLVDSAPSTLDTLNELAAALGDDPNFATTVSNSIGTKWTQDNTKISNWDTAYSWGNHASAGYLPSTHDMTLTLSGDASGSATFTNMGNATLSVTVVNDSHTHDGRYYTESEIETFMKRGYISSHTASNLPVGWYTIATNTGDRASARFGIWDVESGRHQSVTFYAAHHFGTDTSNTLTVLDNSYYNGNPFRYIRIKDAGTYDGAALQVYIDDAGNTVNCAILGDNFQASSWVLCDWIPDATTPPNVSNYANFGERSRVDLNQIAQGGFATTGEIYAGGDTTLYRVFHDNYHPSADKWTTARTLSLTGDASGSVSWDGSANATLGVTVNNDSHTHDGRYYTKTEADNRFVNVTGDSFSGTLTYTGSGVAIDTGGDNIDMGTMTIVGSNGVDGWASKPGIKLDATNDFRIHANSGDVTLYVDGEIYAGAGAAIQKVFHDAYHPNADKWTTARTHTVTLTGDVTGSASQSVDGSGNRTWTITTAVANDSHTHDGRYVNVTGDTMTGTLTAPEYRFTNNDWAKPSTSKWVAGYSDNFASGTSGWKTIAKIRLTSNCAGDTLYGNIYENAYHDARVHQIAIVARAECDFQTNNESHVIEVGCTTIASSNDYDYRNKIRVELVESSTNSRTYELQIFETSWNDDKWELVSRQDGTGNNVWTKFTSGQTIGTSTGTSRVSYRSRLGADQVHARDGMYARTFYDRDDTAYYVDPASTSRLNAVNANSYQVSGATVINSNKNIEFVRASSGTLASRTGFSDFIGYNPSYGSYIGGGVSNAGNYIYAGGYISKGGIHTLWHSGNDGSGSGLDADTVDGLHASSFIRSDADDTASGQYNFTKVDDHAIQVGTIRGRGVGSQTGQYIHLYDRVHIGSPSGWGSRGAPSYGLSTYGGADFCTDTGSVRVGDSVSQTHGGLQVLRNGGVPSASGYSVGNGAHIEIYANNNPVLGFHNSGTSACSLYEDGGDLYLTRWNSTATGSRLWHSNNDGSGSGLDADTLDGIDSTRFTKLTSQIASGDFNTIFNTGTQFRTQISQVANITNGNYSNHPTGVYTYGSVLNWRVENSTFQLYTSHTGDLVYRTGWNNDGYSGWRRVLNTGYYGAAWTSSNDGSGSGLDADLLDGYHASSMLPSAGADIVLSTTPSTDYSNALSYWQSSGLDTNYAPSTDWYNTIRLAHGGGVSYYSNTLAIKMTGGQEGTIWTQTRMNGSLQGWNKYWHSNNDGSGSGLDADLLDGQHASAFAPASHSHSYLPLSGGVISGTLTLQSTNDAQLYLNGNGSTWAGIGWTDVNSTDYMWYRGATGTFAIGGGGSSVSGKKLHIDGGTTIGANLDGTIAPSNGLKVEGEIHDNQGGVFSSYTHSGSDFVNGTLVQTNIPATSSSGASYVLEVTGKSYSSSPPFSFIAQGYLYNNTIINHSGVNLSGHGPSYIKAMEYNGNLCFWWPRISYWNSFEVRARDAGGSSVNRVTSIGNATEPSVTKKVQTNLVKTWNSGNDGSGSGLDADLLDGQHASAFAPASHSHSYVSEGGTSFNGEYPVVVRTSANTIYSDGNIRFEGATSKLTVDGRIDTPIFYDSNDTTCYINPQGSSQIKGELNIRENVSASGYTFMRFQALTTGATLGSIYRQYGTMTYSTNSDYRLKENVVDLSSATERVRQLQPKRFNFIDYPEVTIDGFIAHEVSNVVPEAVIGEKDAIDKYGNPEHQSLDSSKLVPLLTAALQEALDKIDALESRIQALETSA